MTNMRALLVIASSVGLLTCLPSGQAQNAASIFQVVQTPNPDRLLFNDLFAISASSPTDIWAVGYTAIHYDGTSWTGFPVPGIGDTGDKLWESLRFRLRTHGQSGRLEPRRRPPVTSSTGTALSGACLRGPRTTSVKYWGRSRPYPLTTFGQVRASPRILNTSTAPGGRLCTPGAQGVPLASLVSRAFPPYLPMMSGPPAGLTTQAISAAPKSSTGMVPNGRSHRAQTSAQGRTNYSASWRWPTTTCGRWAIPLRRIRVLNIPIGP